MAAKDRLAACLDDLGEARLDRIVGVAGRIHNFLVGEPVFTLTGFRGAGDCAVIAERSGRLTLIVTPAWEAPRAAQTVPQAEIIPSDDLVASLRAALASFDASTSRTAVAGLDLLPHGIAKQVQDLVGPTAQAFDREVRELGQCKRPDEIEDARRATAIAEQGYQHLLKILRPGISEYELSAEIYCHMKGLGAEDNFLLMSSSQHNLAVRTPLRRRLAAGDIVLVELTPCFNGQFSQICRTVCLGQPRPIVFEKYGLLRDAMAQGLGAARPGATMADCAAAMNSVFVAAGYAKYCRPPFIRVRGHGLGIISDLPGDVSEDNGTILQENMVFIIHPNQYLPETGYLMCGEPVRIGRSGAMPLTRVAATLDCVAA